MPGATAEIVADACELDAKQVQCARELYLATPETTWRLLARRDPALRHILICGHNPGLSQVASRFGPMPQRRNLPTGGLATAVWLNAQLGHAAAGDRRELRAVRPGKPARSVSAAECGLRGHRAPRAQI